MARRICQVDDCGRECHGQGFCHKHYGRWRKHGDPMTVLQGKGMRKSHCKYDHALSGDNLRIRVRADGGTTQVCKICSRESVYRVRRQARGDA